MTGIRELARECGVSVATVSRALNGHPEVSATTRRQIQEAASRLGYRPSQSARALVRGRSDTVGLLWDTGYEASGQRHPFLESLLVGLKRALGASGRHLLLLNVDDRDPGPSVYVEAARQHQLEGIVMMGVDVDRPAAHALVHSGLPCVALDMPIRGPRASHVTSDNYAGAVAAVGHLYELGHRRIATVAGPAGMLPAVARLAGFRDAIQDYHLDLPDEYVQIGDFFLASGYAAGQRLSSLADRPTAVFVAGDEMAIGALHAFADQGLATPGQIAVVGFDDIEAASLVRPALTTIAQDPLGLAAAAVELLIALMGAAADSEAAGAGPGAGPGAGKKTGGEVGGLASCVAPRTVPTRLVVRRSSVVTDSGLAPESRR
jgi:LacI family transcriptional regulator